MYKYEYSYAKYDWTSKQKLSNMSKDSKEFSFRLEKYNDT